MVTVGEEHSLNHESGTYIGGCKLVWWYDPASKDTRVLDMRHATAEGFAMFMFVMIGCGTAAGFAGTDWLMVALAFGIGITVLAYAHGHHSGGQINGAVTFSLVLGGVLPWYQGLVNVVFQTLGSFLAAAVLCILFPCDVDVTKSLGSNAVNPKVGCGGAFLAEVFGTFLLCYTVFEVAVHNRSGAGNNAPLAIGLCVFLAHALMLPIDGCSINPTRSIGVAVVGAMRRCEGWNPAGIEDLWIFMLGPFVGAALAAFWRKFYMDRELIDSKTAV